MGQARLLKMVVLLVWPSPAQRHKGLAWSHLSPCARRCHQCGLGPSAEDCPRVVALPPLPGLASLTRLDLFGCVRLARLPLLGALTSLRELDVSHCDSLQELPESFGAHLLLPGPRMLPAHHSPCTDEPGRPTMSPLVLAHFGLHAWTALMRLIAAQHIWQALAGGASD